MTERFTETVSTGIVTDALTGKEYNCEMRIDDDFLNLVNTIADENEQLKKVFRELITSGYWDDDYLTEQDWNDLKRWIENVFEKVMMND